MVHFLSTPQLSRVPRSTAGPVGWFFPPSLLCPQMQHLTPEAAISLPLLPFSFPLFLYPTPLLPSLWGSGQPLSCFLRPCNAQTASCLSPLLRVCLPNISVLLRTCPAGLPLPKFLLISLRHSSDSASSLLTTLAWKLEACIWTVCASQGLVGCCASAPCQQEAC